MANAPWYPKANRQVQYFGNRFPGSRIDPNVVVLHTTETGTWPGYAGGATAPTITVFPDRKRKRLVFRQHFPLNMSSRALRNESGGVETNTLNAVQVELIGTCTRDYQKKYGYFYWPDAPDWALEQLAEFLNWLSSEWKDFPVKDAAPRGWRPYPSSYGNSNGQRMTFSEWRNAYGIVGHQHVPENSHGDPGDFPIDRLIELATGRPVRAAAKRRAPQPKKPNRIQQARALIKGAADFAKDRKNAARYRRLNRALDTLPKR